MNKVLNMTFASSLTDLCEVNSSFDSGILRICYPGANRNNTFISKDSIERCLPTIYNCPIVCNYDRETDTFGGHDIEIVRDSEGGLRIVNVTQPVGVIPESARVWFEEFECEDGEVREYLCAEVLIWKRQEAYRKLKEDGITSHSMELTVKSGKNIDGLYHINDFEFTAFALIGVEPCFEDSALEMFSRRDFKAQLAEMMQELKENINLVNTSVEVDNIHPQFNTTEGGKKVLEEKIALAQEYGIEVEDLEFSIEEITLEELKEKFEAMKDAGSEPEVSTPEVEMPDTENKFALVSNVVDELYRMLREVTIEREWGTCTRYWYVDCDFDINEVYCWDTEDWLLYGFKYSVDGDAILIDFDSKKRKKYVIADFDEGEQASPFSQVFEILEAKLHDGLEMESKYQNASDTIASLEEELGELREFKKNTEADIAKSEREKVFAQFEDLIGVEAFDNLRDNCTEMSIEDIEEKCFAIRGRQNGTTSKFSLEQKQPKIIVETPDGTTEPYGGLFIKYGKKSN